MRNVIIIGIAVFCISITGGASGAITREQTEKLIAAVWKPTPSSIDITYCLSFEDNTKTEKDLREMYEKKYDNIHGPKENLPANLVLDRESTVQKDIERFIKTQQEGGIKITSRVRFDANNVRIDRVDLWGCSQINSIPDNSQDKPIDFNIPFDSSSIEVADQNGSINRFAYINFIKSATIKKISEKERRSIMRERVRYLTLIPAYLTLKTKLGISPNRVCDVNMAQAQIDRLCSGKLDGITIDVSPDENSPDTREKIEILFHAKDSNKPRKREVMVCDKKDYSRVYYYRILNQTLTEKMWSDFDSQGYPHNITRIEYDRDGKVKKREIDQILDVHLNAPIPKEVFEFNPPKDYEILEIDANDTSRVIRYKAGFEGGLQKFVEAARENDINAMKELLGHEEGKIRALSLQSLGFLLAKKPDELKAVVSPLKNDPNQTVRDEAQKILTRLESAEPNKK